MSESSQSGSKPRSSWSRPRRIDRSCHEFEDAWRAGRQPRIEDYLDADVDFEIGLRALIATELELRRKAGENTVVDDYLGRFHGHDGTVRAAFEMETVTELIPNPNLHQRDANALPVDEEPSEIPKRIGRYRIEKVLGKGGFGLVYLAHDEQLDRPVAVKVPHAELISRPEDATAYLAEARTVANLDHLGIVPVHDIGNTDECPCYVVSKYIDGASLSKILKRHRPDYREAVELVANVAEALHYAHQQGLIHRDVKPGNILIGDDGKPYVVDFGLALREDDYGKGPNYAGTPSYMSPEQASGEGHRVDRRSDIFSLGVVLYELLAGRKPFRASTQAELLKQVANFEPRPLRQFNEHLPKELERICQKAMAKRASDRYSSAHDLAEDLRHCLAEQSAIQHDPSLEGIIVNRSETVASSHTTTTVGLAAGSRSGSSSDYQPVKIVPKGLRSFDAHDADFFLKLLPGPCDRAGLPDSLRFWKNRIEEPDPDGTFSVGLIYGPSGCGKSSLVKAGLLPRLSEAVIPIYVEATAEGTETRLLYGLRKRFPELNVNDLDLKQTLVALRRGRGIQTGEKVLIVLDQFEQWLHAKKAEENTEFVQALRQCDGARIQCLVMVRDDFWMAVTRFLRALEVRLQEDHNLAAVDLFPARHAQKVLAAFGRAFGALPDEISKTSEDQQNFLKQSVAGLAEEGKVICVRLALFAEMMKGKSWTPAALKESGGTKGVGVTFLEEAFSSSKASPEHRYHQKAARAVLKALLPDSGTDIKGQMKSYDELLETSGYSRRPDDFEDLIRFLDSEIRLITPTDPGGIVSDDDSLPHAKAGKKCFQLTHDYLVHSLREWLNRKQKETRRGRAELRLAERATLWNARPEDRHLPSLSEWLSIRLLTDEGNWTEQQKKMMARAQRTHGLRSGVGLMVLVAVALAAIGVRNVVSEKQKETQAEGLVNTLLAVETSQVPEFIRLIDTREYRPWTDDKLKRALAVEPEGSPAKLHASLALLPVDSRQVDYLSQQLLSVAPSDLPTIRDALLPHRQQLTERLWHVLSDDGQMASRRFRAACALATYDEGNKERWQPMLPFVARQIVTTLNINRGDFTPVLEAMEPIRSELAMPVSEILRDSTLGASQRDTALSIFLEFAFDDAERLTDVLADADPRQFPVVFRYVEKLKNDAARFLGAEVSRAVPDDASEEQKERGAKRQANAAIALMKLNCPDKIWPLLMHRPDPRARSYFIHGISPLGGDAQALVRRLEVEPDASVRRALLMALGEFKDDELRPELRESLIEKLLVAYEHDVDPGVHAVSEWLLRRSGLSQQLQTIDDRLKSNSADDAGDERNWYMTTQGHTMVLLQADSFPMGSSESDSERYTNEHRRQRTIDRRFAISSKEVTMGQFGLFQRANPDIEVRDVSRYSRTEDSPQVGVNWYDAVAYCNWLSEQEGIPQEQWCYLPNADGEYAAGMRPAADYLTRVGYRLPTEAEWEFACRAGTITSRYYGQSATLLSKYAWYAANSEKHAWPVARLRPNDFGLFDMQGNVFEWCGTRFISYAQLPDVDLPETDPIDDQRRVLRGGGYFHQPPNVRSAFRFGYPPSFSDFACGFRPARTHGRK